MLGSGASGDVKVVSSEDEVQFLSSLLQGSDSADLFPLPILIFFWVQKSQSPPMRSWGNVSSVLVATEPGERKKPSKSLILGKTTKAARTGLGLC